MSWSTTNANFQYERYSTEYSNFPASAVSTFRCPDLPLLALLAVVLALNSFDLDFCTWPLDLWLLDLPLDRLKKNVSVRRKRCLRPHVVRALDDPLKSSPLRTLVAAADTL